MDTVLSEAPVLNHTCWTTINGKQLHAQRKQQKLNCFTRSKKVNHDK